MDLVGDLVRLRALGPDDAQALAALVADPEFGRFLNPWAWQPYSVDSALDFINRHDPDAVSWAVECLADGELLGTTGLHHLDFRSRNCYWGIGIGPPSRWGKGFGTEACRLAVRFAFKELAMEKVYLRVYEGNDRGRRAYEKAGFAVEGTLPRDIWLHGGYATTYLMAVYRENPLYA
jgi:ribosomal-protein-alanine N-acetyltransferase